MYIRLSSQKINGVVYVTHRLVASYRNAEGKVRQETLLNLGTDFPYPKTEWKELADRIEEILHNTPVQDFFAHPGHIEVEAQRIAKLVTSVRSQAIGGKAPAPGMQTVQTDTEKLIDLFTKVAPDYQMVDLNSLKQEDVRHIGAEHVAYAAAIELQLPELLHTLGFNHKQVNIALASIIGRLVAPGSERKTQRYLAKDSSLDELLGTDFTNLKLDQLYLATDRLLKHKDQLETALYQREKSLFDLSECIVLFDLTNTYFESTNTNNPKAKPGRSKEKRSDCPLVTLGLLLDSSGFPRASKIFPGNISEPGAFEEMLNYLGSTTNTTVIMDAGISTQKNIDLLNSNGYKYITVSRSAKQSMPEKTIIVKSNRNNQVKVAFIKSEDGVTELYCHSTAKENKANVFADKVALRYEEELRKLSHGLDSCILLRDVGLIALDDSAAILLSDGKIIVNQPTKLINKIIKIESAKLIDGFEISQELTQQLAQHPELLSQLLTWNGEITKPELMIQLRGALGNKLVMHRKGCIGTHDKLLQKLGRLKEKFKSIASAYEIQVIPDANKNKVLGLSWSRKELIDKSRGIYCLTSNHTGLSETELWNTYTMLTDIESAFRSMKSELGLRPIYHQKEIRVDAHIFICILAYHLLHTILYKLNQKGIFMSWDSVRNILGSQYRITSALHLKDGGTVKIRVTSTATADQEQIYTGLNLSNQPLPLAKAFFT